MGSGHTTGTTPGSDSITRNGSPSEPGVMVISDFSSVSCGASRAGGRTTVSYSPGARVGTSRSVNAAPAVPPTSIASVNAR
jgi:hypothetical protein